VRPRSGSSFETGEAREVHHFCALAGYGAEAINPYLAFETLISMKGELDEKLSDKDIIKRYIKAIDKGMLKVMAKMGISTYQSYCGAQIFDAVGLASEFVDRFFSGTATTIEGVGLAEIAEETVRRHSEAFGPSPVLQSSLEVGGEYALRLRGETTSGPPTRCATCNMPCAATRSTSIAPSPRRSTSRPAASSPSAACSRSRRPRTMDARRCRSAKSSRRRTSSSASRPGLSYGSISREAHTRCHRHEPDRAASEHRRGRRGVGALRAAANGDSMRSAIKQVASGRFGVTTEYLVNSDMMQIKMAQGAKPGEGGQLPATRSTRSSPRCAIRRPGSA